MSLQENKSGVALRKQNKVRPRRDKDGVAKVEDLHFPYNKIRPPRMQKGGGASQLKYNASSEDRKITSMRVALQR